MTSAKRIKVLSMRGGSGMAGYQPAIRTKMPRRWVVLSLEKPLAASFAYRRGWSELSGAIRNFCAIDNLLHGFSFQRASPFFVRPPFLLFNIGVSCQCHPSSPSVFCRRLSVSRFIVTGWVVNKRLSYAIIWIPDFVPDGYIKFLYQRYQAGKRVPL
jgi:hypothetical protein